MKRKLNKKLFRKIRDKIARDGAKGAYDQGTFGRNSDQAPCGTAACIAGWACLMTGELTLRGLIRIGDNGDTDRIVKRAKRVLGLTIKEADHLFTGSPGDDGFGDAWPEPYKSQWERVGSPKARANVAIRYLNHIIETGKVLE